MDFLNLTVEFYLLGQFDLILSRFGGLSLASFGRQVLVTFENLQNISDGKI